AAIRFGNRSTIRNMQTAFETVILAPAQRRHGRRAATALARRRRPRPVGAPPARLSSRLRPPYGALATCGSRLRAKDRACHASHVPSTSGYRPLPRFAVALGVRLMAIARGWHEGRPI